MAIIFLLHWVSSVGGRSQEAIRYSLLCNNGHVTMAISAVDDTARHTGFTDGWPSFLLHWVSSVGGRSKRL